MIQINTKTGFKRRIIRRQHYLHGCDGTIRVTRWICLLGFTSALTTGLELFLRCMRVHTSRQILANLGRGTDTRVRTPFVLSVRLFLERVQLTQF